ncbi:MAG: AEC family transporter [Actinomycetota bacterium]|nr:AEC family transporter [Actinomycetota bacterium]
MSELVTIFADILGPVFVLVAIGFGFGRRFSIDPMPLARFAYYILAPAFIYDVLAGSHLSGDVVARMAAALLIVSAVVIGVAVVAGRLAGRSSSTIAALVLVAVYGNVGNFGLPIVSFKFGEDSLALASVAFLVVNVLAFIIGVTAATWRHSHPLVAIVKALTTPAVAVVPFAVAANVSKTELPPIADRPISLLAAALIPVMLVTLGAQLAAMRRPRITADVLLGSGIRLVIAPLAAVAATALVGLSGVPSGVIVLQSAMPAAVFASIIAMEHDLEPELVTTTVLFTTLASAVTLAVTLAFV